MTEARTPPHSTEAEQAVIGAVLMDNEAWDSTADLLEPGDFYDPEHRGIWATLAKLVNANKPADVVTVYEAGGHELGYLNQLAQSVYSTRAARSYAQIVREHAQRRRVMSLAAALADDARAAMQPVQTVVEAAVQQLLALQQGSRREEPRPLSDVLVEFLDDLDRRAQGESDAISTGLVDLDRLTAGGGRPGELWVLGARPSMGKSAFVLGLARHVGQSRNVLLLSMEDSLMSATARHVAAAGRVNLADLRNPQAAPGSLWEGVAQAADELGHLQVHMDDQAALTMADVRRKVQQVQRRAGRVALVIVDYLQMMDGEGGENRNRELGAIAYGLQKLAKDTGAWVVLLSQLSREADKRSGPPQMGDLRDSGDIEAAARWIGMLHREYMRRPTEDNKHWAQLHVCKQSNGPTDTLSLYFDGSVQRFSNWSGPAPRGGRE
jgi:replicative DNA helicase